MAIDIKFDANQQYQLDAISAVVDLFAGQETVGQSFALPGSADESGMLPGFSELVFGNSLSLSPETLRKNLRAVQDRQHMFSTGEMRPAVPEDLRTPVKDGEAPQDFSVEMETGTGKTYVYLRTIADLNLKYGFSKFVIVVPSVAIREGVLASLDLVKDHLRELYDGLQFDYYMYDSKALTRLRQFANAPHLQILVINIDSFTKETNVINRPTDAMNGYAPIEFLRACRPIVIMDEPQNMETEIRRTSIASLRPLLKVRYSATHRDLKHLVYRLTPVDAYDLRLVKRIGVRGITQQHDLNLPYVEIRKINTTPFGVTATAVIHRQTRDGTRPTQVTLRKDMDLSEESGGREIYRSWIIEDIVAARDGNSGYVEFGNHSVLREGSSNEEGQDQLHRIMIRQAIEAHFERERDFMIKARNGIIDPIKPLTLFFVDKVANYAPKDGKFRVWFEEEYQGVLTDGKNKLLKLPPLSEIHDGYFATTPRGVPKDTREGQETADASRAFELIMRDKERLLDRNEPLRFIFSHSALVEGWDNPNVFVICNLQDGKSLMRKRQQIGRGLRLPIMANGERCRVEEVNYLTVIANEAFETFASSLQREIEEETGVTFRGRIVDDRKRVLLELKPGILDDPTFRALWRHISQRATYQLKFDSAELVADAIERVRAMKAVEEIRFTVREGDLTIDLEKGVRADRMVDVGAEVLSGVRRIPDVLSELSRRTPLSRATIAKILLGSGRLQDVRINPSGFLDGADAAINAALHAQLADRITYIPSGDHWDAQQLRDREEHAFEATLVGVEHSIRPRIPVDSNVEREFARAIDDRQDVKLFLKLPSWFKVMTPLGGYNPDWAIVRQEADGTYLFLVRETKGTTELDDLRFEHERLKIKFGAAHFRAIKVDYQWGRTVEMLGPVSAKLDPR